jgi:3-oxoacyl-[acyl-carrier-protein] synthase-3
MIEDKTSRLFPGSIIDIEYCVPKSSLRNDELNIMFPEWNVSAVEKRVGVFQRAVAGVGETAYDLALSACKRLFDKHPNLNQKIDAVIFCTQTPDYILPSNAFLLHRDLKLGPKTIVFDYNLACSGYVYGLLMASGFIKMGVARNILLVTGDTYSKIVKHDDRATKMLFGDAATATWLGCDKSYQPEALISRFLDFDLGADSAGWDKFIVKEGGNKFPLNQGSVNASGHKIQMDGVHVLNFLNHKVVPSLKCFLEKAHFSAEEISQFLVHQGSQLALESFKNRMEVSSEKVFSNLLQMGNTVSSSIPILIKDYFEACTPQKGSKLVLCSFGVGFSWGNLIAEV